MEKNKKNKGLVVLVIILIILLLSAISYICYDKGIFDNFIENKKLQPEQSQEETKIKIEDVKIVEEENINAEKQTTYLIGKINGQWKELDEDVGVYYGKKDNKIYYSNSKEFKYIDFDKKNFEPTTWIKFEEKDYASGHFVGYLMPTVGILKNDTIYYILNSGPEKIRSLKISATKYSEIEKLATETYDFEFYINDDNILFYPEWIKGKSYGRLVSYNLNTKEKKVIISKNVYDCDFYKDKALIQTVDSSNDDYNHKLYLYDLKTLEKTYISSGENFVGIIGNAVFYLKGNTAMKYENGKKTEIYKYNAPDDSDEYSVRGLSVYNENLIEYHLGSMDNDFFVSDKKIISEKEAQTLVDRYDVEMKNGKIKTFYDYETEKQYIDKY